MKETNDTCSRFKLHSLHFYIFFSFWRPWCSFFFRYKYEQKRRQVKDLWNTSHKGVTEKGVVVVVAAHLDTQPPAAFGPMYTPTRCWQKYYFSSTGTETRLLVRWFYVQKYHIDMSRGLCVLFVGFLVVAGLFVICRRWWRVREASSHGRDGNWLGNGYSCVVDVVVIAEEVIDGFGQRQRLAFERWAVAIDGDDGTARQVIGRLVVVVVKMVVVQAGVSVAHVVCQVFDMRRRWAAVRRASRPPTAQH